MIESYLTQSGYRVNSSNWELYDGVPTSSPIALTCAAPAISFRCTVKVTSVTGHTDCAGSITVGTETLTFTANNQKKITTVLLSSLPTVTYSGLDCNIMIEAIDSGGAPITEETETPIDCRFQDSQKSFRDASGSWSTSQAVAYVNDSGCDIGGIFSHGGYDYQIAQVSVMAGLSGSEEGRKLMLVGKSLAPTGRQVAIPTTEVTTSDYMLKSVYDADSDGIADKAESIRDLDALPESPTEGEIVSKDGKMYIAVTS